MVESFTPILDAASSVEKLGATGILAGFCFYLMWQSNVAKKKCDAMFEEMTRLGKQIDDNADDIKKQMEIANRIYKEVRERDNDFRVDVGGKIARILEQSNRLVDNAQRRRAGDYDVIREAR